MRTRLLIKFLCFLYLLPSIIFSQNKISGVISGDRNIPLAFATIFITDIKDTSKIILGTISDLYGNYRLSPVNKGNYSMNITSLGYEIYKNTFIFSGYDTILNVTLKLKTIALEEVNIKDNSVINSASSTTFIVTKKEIEKSATAFDLIAYIPKIKVDEINKRLTTYSNGNVKILVNGINADEHDVMALKPSDIIKFEYYDIPPARFLYSDISSVINIITRNAFEGIEISTSLQNALFTGFYNDLVSINYNRINYQFKFQYDINYRKYKNMIINENLKYSVNDTVFNFYKTGSRSPMDYIENDISLSFTSTKENNYILNIKLTPDIYKGKNKINQDIFLSKNDLNDNCQSIINNKYFQFNPGIDIYYMNKIKNNDEITFNVVGNLFNAKYENYKSEKSNLTDLSLLNYSTTKGNKISVICEAIYTKPFKHFNFNSGIRNAYSKSEYNDVNNIIILTTTTNTNEGYIFSEVTGNPGKFSYLGNIGLCLNSLNENNNINSYFFKTIRSDIGISYKFSDYSQIKLNGLLKPVTPSLSELSNNYYFRERYFYFKGNSGLKPYEYYEGTMEYSIFKSFITFSGELSCKSSKSTILPQFVSNNGLILQTYDNQIMNKEYSLLSFLQLDPFKKNLLSLILYGKLFLDENKMKSSVTNSKVGNIWASFPLDFVLIQCSLNSVSLYDNNPQEGSAM